MSAKIVLASTSPFRAKMLEQAGIRFSTAAPGLDERAAEAPLAETGTSPEDVAAILAEAKAMAVAATDPDAFVIGSDQTLSLGDRIFHKPADMEAARRHLLALSGRTHQLNTAVAIVRGERTLWRHVEIVRLTMRRLEPAEIGRYLSHVGEAALRSVGSYQIEGRGIRLFERIEGDYFAIVGMPLLPLLASLRELGALND